LTSFRPEDHPDTELSERNLLFIIKTPIRWHMVPKTLIDSGASLNIMMRKTFIEMGLNLADLTPMHDSWRSFQGSHPLQLDASTWRYFVIRGEQA
jgi:hypothetical protein